MDTLLEDRSIPNQLVGDLMVNVDVERHVVPFEGDVTKYSLASTAQVKTTLIDGRVTIDSAKMSVSGERGKSTKGQVRH